MQGRNALDLSEVLKDITPPDLSLAMGELTAARRKEKEQDLFAEKKRKGWDKTVEARCDFTNKPRLTHRAGLYFISLWQKSVYGRTLTDIKSDDGMVEFFSDNMARLITEVLGPNLKDGNWCIITTPKRRHLIKNFATRISEAIAARLDIPFYEDVCSCKNRQRMNAVFTVNLVPKEQNVICFDDFVTTGNTLKSMKVALEKYKLNILFFSGLNNKL